MGFSSWSDQDFTNYATRTGYRSTNSVEAVFTNHTAREDMLLKNIRIRESRNSETHPHAVPIILGLDVTGSMGKYAMQIAQNVLPEVISGLINDGEIQSPHIMVMGIGDPRAHDFYPGQATQFEPDVKLIEQVRDLYIEGRGGGNSHEGYDLAWYVAQHLAATDAKTEGRKGYIITFGDEPIAPAPLTESEWRKVFGDREYPQYETMHHLVAATLEHWNLFHIVIAQGNYCNGCPDDVVQAWADVIGSRVLVAEDSKDLDKIIRMVIRIEEAGEVPPDLYEDDLFRSAFRVLLANE